MAANTPIAAEPITVTADSKVLSRCLSACMKHYATDDTRPSLNRVHIIMEEQHAIFECTNGYTALRYRIPVEGLGPVGDVTYQLDRNQVKAIYATLPKSGPYYLEVQPCTSSYPDLERLIPTPAMKVQFSVKYLTDALAACKGMEYLTLGVKSDKESMTIFARNYPSDGADVTVLLAPAHTNDS